MRAIPLEHLAARARVYIGRGPYWRRPMLLVDGHEKGMATAKGDSREPFVIDVSHDLPAGWRYLEIDHVCRGWLYPAVCEALDLP